jgi:anti-sigma factor RsiW
MECSQLEEAILDSIDAAMPAALQREIDAHLAQCPACARFAATQRALDAGLSAMLVPATPSPALRPALRRALRKKIRLDTLSAWRDALPDIMHLGSCAAATLWCALLLPADTALVLGTGATTALLTYVLMTMVRNSLDDGLQRR